jgi:ACT domain-containing protein
MRAMIQAAMASRDPNAPLAVHVVDPSREALKSYADFFKPLGLKEGEHLWQLRFGKAVRTGCLENILETVQHDEASNLDAH